MGPITVSTPGKIILLGEHSVVYGNSAFASSLSDLRINITLRETTKHQVTMICHDSTNTSNKEDWKWSVSFDPALLAPLFQGKDLSYIKEKSEFLSTLMGILHVSIPSTYSKTFLALCYLLNTYCSDFCQDQTLSCGYDFDIESHGLPFGAGLGSSASISCSLSFLVYLISKTYQDPSYDIQAESVQLPSSDFVLKDSLSTHLNRWAYECECIFHGTPSGVDNTVCMMGHSLHFRKGQFEVKSCPSISLLIINTNVPKNTKEMVSKVRQLYTSFPSIIQPLFDSINEQIRYVLEVEQESEFYSRLSNVIPICHHLLQTLNVSHPAIEQCRNMIDRDLHLPSKLTGAGGGGCLYTILPRNQSDEFKQKLSDLLKAIEELHMTYYITNISGNGLKFTYC